MSVTSFLPATLARAAIFAGVLALGACAGEPLPPSAVGERSTPAPQLAAPVDPRQATFAFEPFTGAPGNIADALSQEIGAQARAQNLRLVRRVGAPASYRVNGYLSASGDQSSTTMFYVLDVVDANGNRVHRVLGQEASSGSSGDPWAGVDEDTIRRAARRSVADLAAWLRR